MSVERMKDYWNPENILADDEELLVLRVLKGPEKYTYSIRLREAAVDTELTYETTDKNMFMEPAIAKFEEQIIGMLRQLNKDMINEDGPGKAWRNRRDKSE